MNEVEARSPADEHVRVYLRIKLRAAQVARAASEAADRYEAAIAGQEDRVKAIASSQAHPIEPVRYQRDVAPAVWTDPEQRNKFSKTPEKVVGFRRVDEMVRLEKRGTITKLHLAAGIKLRDDYEIGELGGRQGLDLTEIRTGGDGGTPSQVRLDALARYRGAVQAVGPRLSTIMLHVVISNGTVTSWAERRVMSLSRATGYLEAAMDRLADHYDPHVQLADIERAEELAG